MGVRVLIIFFSAGFFTVGLVGAPVDRVHQPPSNRSAPCHSRLSSVLVAQAFEKWRTASLSGPKVPAIAADPDMAYFVDLLLGFNFLRFVHSHYHAMDPKLPLSTKFLNILKADIDVHRIQADSIPKTGPLVVVSNHIFGFIDGMALLEMVKRVRPDVKLMVTDRLKGLVNSDDLIYVDNNLSGTGSTAGLKSTLAWLKSGGALIVFPAGVVSRWNELEGKPVDTAWAPTIARIIQKTKAPVLPAFIEGRNSWLFYFLGKRNEDLYTYQLIREVKTQRGRKIRIRLGPTIPPVITQDLDSDVLVSELRKSVYRLADSVDPFKASEVVAKEAIAPPENPELLASEIRRIEMLDKTSSRVLYGNSTEDSLRVIQMNGKESEIILRELTRLREEVFRPLGEGSGKKYDRDIYDDWYRHFILWDPKAKRIVGAYRAWGSDLGNREHMYTAASFDYDWNKILKSGPRLELGRAFVLKEYAGGLDYLWQAIGAYLVRNPQYAQLIGMVSMSKQFSPYTHHLVVEFLRAQKFPPEDQMIGLPKPEFEMHQPPFSESLLKPLVDHTHSIKELQAAAERIEGCRTTTEIPPFPQLIKHYGDLLGGKVLGFLCDPHFGSIDIVMEVSIDDIRPRIRSRFFGGEEAVQKYFAERELLRARQGQTPISFGRSALNPNGQ